MEDTVKECFVIELRLEELDGKPIESIHVADLPEVTFESLVKEAILKTFPNENQPIDMEKYEVTLRYDAHAVKEWWPNIHSTADLELAFQRSPDKGFLRMSASVQRKIDMVASAPQVVESAPPVVRKRKASSKPTATRKKSKDGRSVGEKIMCSMAELRPLNIIEPPRVQVALFAGYKNVKSAGFAKALSQLKNEGMIEYPTSKTVRLSNEGLNSEATKSVTPPKDNAAVHERLKQLLTPTTIKVFDVLKDGRVHNRKDVADASGYSNEKSAGFAKALSTMSSLGIIHYPKDDVDPKKKQVQLTSIAFPYPIGEHVIKEEE